MQPVDMIINCGTLLCIAPNNDVQHNKSIIIDKGIIVDILSISDSYKYTAKEVLNYENQLVMPGFINTHTHIGMSYFKGMADDLPLYEWLNHYIWPAESKYINADFIHKSSLHGIAELIKNGITCFNDMYFITEETARVCINSGMRALLGGSTVMDFPIALFHKPDELEYQLYKNIEYVKHTPLIDITIAPHSCYTVSKESWVNAINFAQKENLIIHTHLCETEKEVLDCKKQYGKSPVEFLHSLGAFDNKFIFAHGIHLDDNDFNLIKDSDCSVAINLHSNLKLASGIPPIAKYIENNINISFGTDSVASNNTLSLTDEISTAAKLYKVIYSDPSFLHASELVKMSTLGAAKALGKDDVIGSIEIGKSADIISIDVHNFLDQPIYDPFSYIVYGMNRESISNVLINGKIVMKDRKLLTIDEDELLVNVLEFKKNYK